MLFVCVDPDFKSKLLTAKNQVVLEAELGAALKQSAGAKHAGSKDLALNVVTDRIRQIDEMRKAQTNAQAGGKRTAPGAMDAHRPENSAGAPVSKRDNYLGPAQKVSAMGSRASMHTRGGMLGCESHDNRDGGGGGGGGLSKGAQPTNAAGGVHRYLSVDPLASIHAGTPGNNMSVAMRGSGLLLRRIPQVCDGSLAPPRCG